MKIDLLLLLDKYITDGYILVNKHPEHNLRILNYSRKVQFEKFWNSFTLLCRGLIIDDDGNIVAMPFVKFFNYEEHKPEEIPNTNFEVYDKEDGSLGIIFNYENKWHVATRGSFVSEQAIKAKSILSKYNIVNLNPEHTYLVEIIYESNRIVLDYFGDEKLILLGIIDNKTGYDFTYDKMVYHTTVGKIDFPLVKRYDGVNDIKELKARNLPNKEGYVIRYDNGFRMKLKFEDYCRLHSIITNISTKDIWECLRDGRNIDELLDRTPDEFDEWVRGEVAKLKENFYAQEWSAKDIYNSIRGFVDNKKDFAQQALKFSCSAILFKMFEGKSYDNIIWKMIEPKWSKPFFKQDDEE